MGARRPSTTSGWEEGHCTRKPRVVRRESSTTGALQRLIWLRCEQAHPTTACVIALVMAGSDETTTEVQVFLGNDELWYWRIEAENHKIIGAAKCGEESEQGAIAQFSLLAHHLGAHTPAEFYREGDKPDGDWRWKLEADGDVVGKASEGYKDKRDCEANLEQLRTRVGNGYTFHEVL